ncbi:MAG: hypothetical protein ABI353_16910 [Isosphaeraceae bacterium]
MATAKLFELAGAKRAHVVLRSVGESREFEAYSEFLAGEREDAEEESELLGTEMDETAVCPLYRRGTCLTADVGGCTLSKRLKAEIRGRLSPEMVGDFSLNSMHLRVGGHDVFRLEDDVPVRIDRFFVSMTFQADGIPDDPEGLLNRIRQLEEFRSFLEQFEAEFGAAKVAILTDD